MKKCTVTLLLLALYAGASAQYKKASFFEKEGRTYSFGARMYAIGDGKGSPVGFYAAFGTDKDGKRLFSWWEIQYIPPFKFTANVIDRDDNPVTVHGKARTHLIYAANWGWHILKPGSEPPKVQPYLTAGFNLGILGGVKEMDNDNYDNKPIIAERAFSCGIGGGAGCFYNITPGFGLKVEGGYTLEANIEIESSGATKTFYMFTKHPYVSAGVRFRIITD